MKKVLLVLLGLVLAVAIALPILRYQTKKHSPAATLTHQNGNAKITVQYCRPFKKGRTIFGTKESGALQPYGEYWRMGANEATSIDFSADVLVGGKKVNKGTYNLYAYPGEDTWDILLGTDWDRWGAAEPSKQNEVLRLCLPANNQAEVMEQFTMHFNQSGNLVLHWDQTMVEIPISGM